ncbi:MAG: 30S ribosomal protein S5 [uncultured bacterium]|nr:MAG: 30S ribosomal protein S5 [uncultured bacterium]
MEKEKKEFEERVIEISRVSRTVKGGRRLRFRALVAIGNLNGKIGIGIGKANEVAQAVQKAVNRAKKNMISVTITNNTILHEVKMHFGGAYIFLKPAAPGTSVIAGSTIRTVIELAGIKNILSKAHGSSNKINNVMATFLALDSLSNRSVGQDKYISKLKDKADSDENIDSSLTKSESGENKKSTKSNISKVKNETQRAKK